MKHKTEFENMNATQRSLHNLICILEDEAATYEQSISNAIDEITNLKQQRDELKTAWANAAADLAIMKLERDELLEVMSNALLAWGMDHLSHDPIDLLTKAIDKHIAQGDKT